jgi:hypothetical protein
VARAAEGPDRGCREAERFEFSRVLLRGMMRARALREHGDAGHRTSPLLGSWVENLHPAVQEEALVLVASGALPLHDYAHALNSSQAFAMNLFLPVRVGERREFEGFLQAELGRAVRVTGVELEYFGSGDLLAEIPDAEPGPEDKLTRADVAVHLLDDSGRRGLLLVEVKLTEAGFTTCGGAESRGNRDRAPCRSAEVFLSSPERCYLQRPYRARRDRRYWELFTNAHGRLDQAFPGVDPGGPCPFRGDWQQPMRNHALGLAAVDAGLVDFWAHALVHHDGNPDVVQGWTGYVSAAADADKLFRWPASRLLPALDAALPGASFAAWLQERYLFEEMSR